MTKSIGVFIFFTLVYFRLSAQSLDQLSYIERHKLLAISEMERTGIPASIKLAQAILESSWGKSELATKGNNYFGIKCGRDWGGKKIFKEDDDRDSLGNLVPSCFRAFSRVEDSFIAHSEFLKDPTKSSRYGHLFSLSSTDYVRWAEGLKNSGYATNPQYASLLIGIIEKYSLYQYDSPLLYDMVVFEETKEQFYFVNNLKYTFPRQGETVEEFAKRVKIDPAKIIQWNEILNFNGQVLSSQMMVFLQSKKASYTGGNGWHTVREGDNILTISQLYGVMADKIYSRNKLVRGMEPVVGARIKLKGLRVRVRPPITSEDFYFTTQPIQPFSDPFSNPDNQELEYAFPEALPGNLKSSRKGNQFK
jgi:hypothetical protein